MPYKIINAGAYLNGQVLAGIITQEDADLIREFYEERKATKHIAEATALVTSKGRSQSLHHRLHPSNNVRLRT